VASTASELLSSNAPPLANVPSNSACAMSVDDTSHPEHQENAALVFHRPVTGEPLRPRGSRGSRARGRKSAGARRPRGGRGARGRGRVASSRGGRSIRLPSRLQTL